MIDKQELINEIEKTAEKKGFSVVPAILAKKKPDELEGILNEMKKAPLIGKENIAAQKVNQNRMQSRKEEKEIQEKQKTENINPFNIPLTIKEAKKWAEAHLDLLTSQEFINWARTPGGKKFLHDEAGSSQQLYDTLEERKKINEKMKSMREELTGKAGNIGIVPKKKPKTIEELKRDFEKLKKRKQELESKEKEMPGFLYLRKKETERMKKQREEAMKNLKKKYGRRR